MSRPGIEPGYQDLASCAIIARPPQHDTTGPRHRAFDVFQGSCYTICLKRAPYVWKIDPYVVHMLCFRKHFLPQMLKKPHMLQTGSPYAVHMFRLQWCMFLPLGPASLHFMSLLCAIWLRKLSWARGRMSRSHCDCAAADARMPHEPRGFWADIADRAKLVVELVLELDWRRRQDDTVTFVCWAPDSIAVYKRLICRMSVLGYSHS